MNPGYGLSPKGIRSFKDDTLFAQSILYYYSRYLNAQDVFKNPLLLFSESECIPLPAPVEIAEEKVVGPSLGEDSIVLGRKSAMIS